jgi:hypothetical protein
MGDLNFRTKLPDTEAGSTKHVEKTHNLLKDWETLNKHDELAKALREKRCLVGFGTSLLVSTCVQGFETSWLCLQR